MFFQITLVFSLYIWCAAADPADPGVFKSKKYLKIPDSAKNSGQKESKLGGESTSSLHDANAIKVGEKPLDEDMGKDAASKVSTVDTEKKNTSQAHSSCLLLACSPFAYICNCAGSSEESSTQQMSEEGMFYCSLCEVEVCRST